MKKSGTPSRKNKAISIRRHLPLSMRARYDAVRNSAPVKAVGMGVMVLIGVFGILLATQTVSPTSSASSTTEVTVIQASEGVAVSKVSERAVSGRVGELLFEINLSPVSSRDNHRLSDQHSVEYYALYSASAVCEQTTVVSREPSSGSGRPGSRVPGVTSIYNSAATVSGDRHAAAFADNAKSVCVRVQTARRVNVPPRPKTKYFWGFYSIAVNRPTTTTTTQTALRITLGDVTQNGSEYTFSSNRSAYWDFSYIDQGDACEGTVSVYRGSQYLTSYTATLTAAQNGRQYCIKARDLQNNHAYKKGTVNVATTTTTTESRVTTPNFTVSGVNQTGYEVSFVVASTDRRAPTSVQVYRATGSSVTCPTSSGSYPHDAGRPSSTYPGGTGRVYTIAVLGGTNMTRNICVKVAYSQNSNQVYEIHGAFPVNASSTPLITIVKNGDREYRASASYVAANSWRNVVNSSRTCTERNFVHQGAQVQGVQTGSSYTVPENVGTTQNGKYVCFRVRGTNGVYGYKSTVINTVAIATAPEVTTRVALITVPPATSTSHIVLTADSDQDIAATYWFYIVVANSVFNSYSNTGTIDACERLLGLNPIRQDQTWLASGQMLAPINGDAKKAAIYLDLSHGGRFVCIKAANDNGTDYVGRLLPQAPATAVTVTPVTEQPVVVTPPAPSIIITSDNREYRASASGIVTSSWQHVVKSSSACAERDFASSPRSGSSYTVAESAGTDQNGQYVCFRVRGAGTNGIYGYKSTVINVTVEDPDAPSIVITSDNREYRASASGIVTSSWQHVVKSSSACAEGDFASSPRSGSSYTVAESAGTDQNGQYVCFRVRGAGTNGIYGYKSTVINVTVEDPDAPSIVITSDNREYRASASGIVTSSWQHVVKSSSACAEGDFASSPRSGSSYTVAESAGTDQNGQYVCFRVRGAGTNGIYGYKSTVINVTVEDPDAPSIVITSDNREYRASSSGIVTSSWQHVVKSSSACAEGDFASSPRSGSSYTVAESAGTDQNGQYVCFRVRGAGTNGIYGYKSTVINVTVEEREDTTETGLRVDDTAPDVEEIATAGDGEGRNWSQLAGYLLVAGAVLGIARVLIIKKYKQMG